MQRSLELEEYEDVSPLYALFSAPVAAIRCMNGHTTNYVSLPYRVEIFSFVPLK